MKKSLAFLCTMMLIFSVGGIAAADVLTFDDFTGDFAPVPSDYAGFNWVGDFYVFSDSYMTSMHYNPLDSPSGEYAASTDRGTYIVSLNDSDFQFEGASFAGWGKYGTGQSFTSTTVTVWGYNNGALVGSATMDLSPTEYNWLPVNLLVDEVWIQSSGQGQYWLMDDFTYAPVPEPATMLLFGMGLIGIACVGRKRLFS
jgi:hypothetical protein